MNVSEAKLNVDAQISQLHEAVKNYIIKNMGKKGYIDTQNGSLDTMYFYSYKENIGGEMVEGIIKGIRVSGDNIQIIGTENFVGFNLVYHDKDFKKAARKTKAGEKENASLNGDWENYWQDIECSDFILYAQTLMSIADSIEQYGENEDGE